MRTFVALALICLAFSSKFFNKDFVAELKKKAPFEVYDVDKNPFKDWTDEEIRGILTAQVMRTEEKPEEEPVVNAAYDFRSAHPECMIGIRNQASCGSCWAFSGAEALQERFCLKSGGSINLHLSPQDSVSCDTKNYGCDGGYLSYTWLYYKNTGLVSEACWPYSSASGTVEACNNFYFFILL